MPSFFGLFSRAKRYKSLAKSLRACSSLCQLPVALAADCWWGGFRRPLILISPGLAANRWSSKSPFSPSLFPALTARRASVAHPLLRERLQ